MAQTLTRKRKPVAQAMKKQDWQIKEIVAGARLYSENELLALLEGAPIIEKQMKTGADSKRLLEQWIINACTKK